jgi:eukaryotic-like serine/threonine-protein kinase
MSEFVSHYRVLDRIGRGAMGDTYAGRDERHGRLVALKFMDAGMLRTEGARRRFLRDVRAAAEVRHPAICAIYDVVDLEEQPVIVLERVAGQTALAATARGPLPAREVSRLGRDLADALAAIHASGMVHANISAANVMIDQQGQAKLMDLGLSLTTNPGDTAAESTKPDVHSRTMLLGTPVYLAPELLRGGQPTPKSDLYALGVVLYRLSTGTHPFAERMTPDSLSEMLMQPPVPPSLLVSGIPPSLERAVLGLLEKHPNARFPSADSLAATLALADR